MPNKKMTFPPIPGGTPRDKFINLARHVISAPKSILTDQERSSSTKPRRTHKTKGVRNAK